MMEGFGFWRCSFLPAVPAANQYDSEPLAAKTTGAHVTHAVGDLHSTILTAYLAALGTADSFLGVTVFISILLPSLTDAVGNRASCLSRLREGVPSTATVLPIRCVTSGIAAD